MNYSLLNFFDSGSFILIIKLIWPLFIFIIIFKLLEYFVQKNSFKYFLRKNKLEFFTLVFAVIGYIISYIFLKAPGLSFLLSIVVTFLANLVIIYSKIREKDFYFISLQKDSDREDWIGDGLFQYERVHHSYAITNSHSGFIFSKCLTWSDYVFDFQFKILNTSLGVIVRAVNLSNTVMMQIFENGIKAHIRINGFWKAWEPTDAKLVFNQNLNLDQWYRARLQCDKGSIRIRIFNKENNTVIDRVWKIPSGEISFSYLTDITNKENGFITKSTTIPFPINLDYGTIGFRNHGSEKALIKEVLVEKLQRSNREY